jgi:natural product biosynthesis luciferase-like monooxygenase protein
MRFGLFFFAASGDRAEECYNTILDLAAWGERTEFSFLSIPERHYHRFGGAFPNPHILLAALSQRTKTIQLRYGSLISPLHHSVELAENLSMLWNLAGGRIAVSFGSGWNVRDFVLEAGRYVDRRTRMWKQIDEIVGILNSGQTVVRDRAGDSKILVYPSASRIELPIWITASGNAETCKQAGAAGYNLLTHLEKSSLSTLARNIEIYRSARLQAGHAAEGCVTVMMHTFVSEDQSHVHAAKEALRAYLTVAIDLERQAVLAGGRMSGGRDIAERDLDEAGQRDAIVEAALHKYLHSAALIGTLNHCAGVVQDLQDIGVSEVACLMDFADPNIIARGLDGLAALVASFSDQSLEEVRRRAVRDFMTES